MIFSSYPFILAFLPAAVAATLLFRNYAGSNTVLLLGATSLIFYGYWDWRFVWVIGLSIVVNYAAGREMGRGRSSKYRRRVLIVGIVFNLVLLGYFKYTDFFIANVAALISVHVPALNVVLPLGISFFTFQQIAYLVDVYRHETVEHDFRHYFLFVTFFPQLIAGPIVHHKEMMPQFIRGQAGRIDAAMAAQGVTIFFVGVAKKVLVADNIALFASPVFDAAARGVPIAFVEAWGGALAYTFQIYFDFSAYSDMAIGLGLIFGLRLPINFNSPYKATSLIEFWRRWHITLSRFLRDYLYIPLGGNRLGERRRLVNIMVVMLLGGLWHGANWTFVAWGGLHGLGLLVNHLWRRWPSAEHSSRFRSLAGWTATFLFVIVAWVFFRADSFGSALNILVGMTGTHGIVLPDVYRTQLGILGPALAHAGVRFEAVDLFFGSIQVEWTIASLAVVTLLPNSVEWAGYDPITASDRIGRPRWYQWCPSVPWALTLSALSVASLIMMSKSGEFLYFQF